MIDLNAIITRIKVKYVLRLLFTNSLSLAIVLDNNGGATALRIAVFGFFWQMIMSNAHNHCSVYFFFLLLSFFFPILRQSTFFSFYFLLYPGARFVYLVVVSKTRTKLFFNLWKKLKFLVKIWVWYFFCCVISWTMFTK